MSKKEIDKYDIISRLLRDEINGPKASALLSLSTRQVRRLKCKVKIRGAKGLIHANRGKPSNRKISKKERDKITALLHKHYADFGPTLAAEKLEAIHEIIHDPSTIRAIMINEKLWTPRRPKRGSKHYAWRQRKATFGEMIQFDGSYHDWFEGRSRTEKQCLLAAIDDATGRVTQAVFGYDEGVFPVFGFWKQYMEKHGKPRSIYLDKFSTYRMNQKVAQENHELKTQFQRAMNQLDIEPITAHSAQAKGRVERLFETLQDRLIKEMRLKKINTIKEANRFLKDEFLPDFNSRFSVVPRSKANLHRALVKTEKKELGSIFSRHTERTVRNDFTISFNQWFQLTKQQPATVCKKDKVMMEEHLDGSVKIRLRDKYLSYEILPERPKKTKDQPWVLPKTAPSKQPYKSSLDHPWRRYEYAKASKRTN